MKSSILFPFSGAILAAGMLMAQPATQPATQTPAPAKSATAMRSHRRALGGPAVEQLTRMLKLTPDQQNRANTIFADARKQTKTIQPQLRSEREALSAAIRSDDQARIDRITSDNAQLNSQEHAIHAKAMAKLYSILTPDQKATFDKQMVNAAWRGRFRRARRAG